MNGTLNHSELVQLATDMMSDASGHERWVPSYDAALSSKDDAMLEGLIRILYANVATRDLRGMTEALGTTQEVVAVEPICRPM